VKLALVLWSGPAGLWQLAAALSQATGHRPRGATTNALRTLRYGRGGGGGGGGGGRRRWRRWRRRRRRWRKSSLSSSLLWFVNEQESALASLPRAAAVCVRALLLSKLHMYLLAYVFCTRQAQLLHTAVLHTAVPHTAVPTFSRTCYRRRRRRFQGKPRSSGTPPGCRRARYRWRRWCWQARPSPRMWIWIWIRAPRRLAMARRTTA
jgi:hypothetical protein